MQVLLFRCLRAAKGRHGDQTNWLIQLTGLFDMDISIQVRYSGYRKQNSVGGNESWKKKLNLCASEMQISYLPTSTPSDQWNRSLCEETVLEISVSICPQIVCVMNAFRYRVNACVQVEPKCRLTQSGCLIIHACNV